MREAASSLSPACTLLSIASTGVSLLFEGKRKKKTKRRKFRQACGRVNACFYWVLCFTVLGHLQRCVCVSRELLSVFLFEKKKKRERETCSMVKETAVWAVNLLHAFKNKSMSSLSVALWCHPSQRMEFAGCLFSFLRAFSSRWERDLTLHSSRESRYEIATYGESVAAEELRTRLLFSSVLRRWVQRCVCDECKYDSCVCDGSSPPLLFNTLFGAVDSLHCFAESDKQLHAVSETHVCYALWPSFCRFLIHTTVVCSTHTTIYLCFFVFFFLRSTVAAHLCQLPRGRISQFLSKSKLIWDDLSQLFTM